MRNDILGNFQVTSGKVIITDPCYKFDENQVMPARNGRWIASMSLDNRGHIRELIATHIAYTDLQLPYTDPQCRMVELDITCSVDSGQAGIFDADRYNQHQGGEYDQQDTLYGQCCHLTGKTIQSGGLVTIDGNTFGVVSNSGYGDGEYMITGQFYEDQLVGVVISFVEDYDDEDWE